MEASQSLLAPRSSSSRRTPHGPTPRTIPHFGFCSYNGPHAETDATRGRGNSAAMTALGKRRQCMRAMLIGSAGPLIGREFNLDAAVITIGRRDENDIVIKDPTVSRNHAEIRQEGGDLVLRDTGSTSGTVV